MKPMTKALLTVAVILVIALAALGALISFNKSPDLLDSEFRVIVSGSMDGKPQDYPIPTIPVNSLIAVHKLQGDDVYNVVEGDVIGFYSPIVNGNIYHRVKEVHTDKKFFVTHGDANPSEKDEIVNFDEANGIVVNVSKPAGEFVTFVKQNIFFLVAAVILILIMSEAVFYLMKTWKE